MRTIADSYVEEGYNKCVAENKDIWLEKGMEKGMEEKAETIAINMMKHKVDINFVADVTGLHVNKLLGLTGKNIK